MQNQTSQQGVQSIEVGNRLLKASATAGRPLMLKELAELSRMPPAKAHRYLVSLIRTGFMEQHPVTGLYDLGPFALELGLKSLGRLAPVAAAEPHVIRLRETIRQTVALAVWSKRGPIIASWFGLDAPVSATLRVGAVMPLTRSATGLAFLSFLPSETTASLLKHELAENRRGALPPHDRRELTATIEKARRQGYAATQAFIPGIAGVAAPVFDHSGTMTLALIALGYTAPFNGARRKITDAVSDVAKALSERLGGSVSTLP